MTKYTITFAGRLVGTADTLKAAEKTLRGAAQLWRAGDLLPRQGGLRRGGRYTAVRWDRGQRRHRGLAAISFELKERGVFAGDLVVAEAARETEAAPLVRSWWCGCSFDYATGQTTPLCAAHVAQAVQA